MFDKKSDEIQEHQMIVKWLLAGGLGSSVVLMVIGLIFNGMDDQFEVFRMTDFWNPLVSWPQKMMGWGILILAMTPILRVMLLMLLWARRKDWTYFSVSVVVLVTLAYAALGSFI